MAVAARPKSPRRRKRIKRPLDIVGPAFSLAHTGQIRARYFASRTDWIELTDAMTGLEWHDSSQQAAREFTLSLDNWNGQVRSARRGGVVILYYGPVDGRWVEWFRGTVTVNDFENTPDLDTGTLTVADPMRVFGASEGSFTFRNGLTASQHIKRLATRARIPMGLVEDTNVKLPSMTYQGTWWEAIQVLLLKTRQLGGRRYVLEFAEGKLWLFRWIDPVYQYRGEATLSGLSIREDITNVKTSVKLQGSYDVEVGPKNDKRSVTKQSAARAQANDELLRAFGVIEVVDSVDEANASKPEIRRAAKQRLAQLARPEVSFELRYELEALTLRRLMPIAIPHRDPVTGIFGKFFVSDLQGSVRSDGASMTIRATRNPEFPPAPTGSLELVTPPAAATPGGVSGSSVNATTIDRYLATKGSPLSGLGSTFVAAGRRYGIDPRLLPAISGAETSFGTTGNAASINNAWGWGPHIAFASWEQAIFRISKGLREIYINEGRTTIQAISQKWAPVGASNDPTNLNSNWPSTVSTFYQEMGGNPSASVAI